jgi:serine/threonine protein kinase
MGAVYEAEQEHPRRVVALKVIKPGLVSTELLRRFEHEVRALGRLQHPGIAQIYEAGTAESGFVPQPYFAMEFIRGRPLLEYAGQEQLKTRAGVVAVELPRHAVAVAQDNLGRFDSGAQIRLPVLAHTRGHLAQELRNAPLVGDVTAKLWSD